MFNLIVVLVVAVVAIGWVVYRKKKKKAIFPKGLEPSTKLLAVAIIMALSYCVIGMNITMYQYIKNYDEIGRTISQEKNNLVQLETQLETQMEELDAKIEGVYSNTELSEEERIETLVELKIQKRDLETELVGKRGYTDMLQSKHDQNLYNLFKFLLYFENQYHQSPGT